MVQGGMLGRRYFGSGRGALAGGIAGGTDLSTPSFDCLYANKLSKR